MIFQTPKKLISVAKAFSPAWLNLSPARLFASNPTPDESMIFDPPTWPENVARNEFSENGIPIDRHRRLKRCYGPNGSFHQSIRLKQFEADRAYNAYQKKRTRYEAQQAREKLIAERTKPVPIAELHRQALQQLGTSDDPEDRIFLAELGRLRILPDNFQKFAPIGELLESLEEHRLEAEHAILRARASRAMPSFSTFQRQRRTEAAREAATRQRRRQKAQGGLPSTEEKVREERKRKVREERKRKVREERKRKEEQYAREQTEDKEAASAYAQKMRDQVHRAIIRDCLENGRPAPAHLQYREDLIREITHSVYEAAQRKKQEAALRAEAEQQRLFALQQEANRIAEEQEALHRQEAIRIAQEQREALLRQEAIRQQEAIRRQEAIRVAREQAAHAEFLRQARLAEEEARRIEEERQRVEAEEARRAQEEDLRQAREQHDRQATALFQIYDAKWAALRGADLYADITFEQFPWPIMGTIADINAITDASVQEFYTYRGIAGKAMRAEILKWHPDKLNNQLYQVHAEHRERVREAGELVAKILNQIMRG